MTPVEIGLLVALGAVLAILLALVVVNVRQRSGKRAGKTSEDGSMAAVLVPVAVVSDGGASCSADGGGGAC